MGEDGSNDSEIQEGAGSGRVEGGLQSTPPKRSGTSCTRSTRVHTHCASPEIRPMDAMISRESRRTIREDASTSRSQPLASTRAVGSQQSPPVWRRPPTARLAAPTHQNHGTAARISRQTDRTIREDASTSHSQPLASTRAVGSQRSTSQHPPVPCSPTVLPRKSGPWMR